MSIMSKYVVSTMIVSHQKSQPTQIVQQDESFEGAVASQDEASWWSWRWLQQKGASDPGAKPSLSNHARPFDRSNDSFA